MPHKPSAPNSLLFLWTLLLLALPATEANARKASPLAITQEEFQSERSRLLDTALPQPGLLVSFGRDTACEKHPRDEMLRNLYCHSNRTAYPVCTTYVHLEPGIAALVEVGQGIDGVAWDAFASRRDAHLRKTLEPVLPRINYLEMRFYEETDKSWAVLGGLMYTAPVLLGMAGVELIASQLSQRRYNPAVPLVPFMVAWIGVSTVIYVKIDPAPTLRITRIRFAAR